MSPLETTAVGHPRILLLNGPNLNKLGQRDAAQYGRFTLDEAVAHARHSAERAGYVLDARQSNHEGELIDWVQEAVGLYDALLINAGAYTHYSIALADALDLFAGPKIELHISDIYKREAFRQHSALRRSVDGQISGLGIDSYRYAVEQAIELLEGKRLSVKEGRTDEHLHQGKA